MIIQLLMLTISGVFLARTVLIIAGYLKGPVLQRFERYGPEEFFYQPIPMFLVALSAFLISFNEVLGTGIPIAPLVVLFLLVAYGLWAMPEFSHRYPKILLRYPYWLTELKERTGRYERRRIAYMWLRLPKRLKSVYNSNDRAFQEWADFVILGTLS
ncbi:MAG: hypothetical protein L0154_24595 [Chloroflexi bacterium]|nr:hypothetical protein [Chloroflexota bacterium]